MLSTVATSWSPYELDLWQAFQERHGLTIRQCEQFQAYYRLLVDWNEKYNLTAITALTDALAYHFDDALMVLKHYDFARVRGCGDVGSGGGIPGIPLAIACPHVTFYLIEVIRKKREFLAHVAELLGLENVVVCDHDWRTFLRSTDWDIQIFCARASLSPRELVRAFGGTSHYQDAGIIYWASAHWQPEDAESSLLHDTWSYTVGERTRAYAFFTASEAARLLVTQVS